MDTHTFLMMGRPGSGKGTQGKLLARKLGCEIYSSGNRLREMAKGHGFVAAKIKKVIDEGGLLPAWLSSHMFVDVLLGTGQKETIIFEGACRRLHEAQAFDETAGWLERPYKAIFLNIPDEEVERRIADRRKVEGRADDASDTVDHRLVEYKEHTAHAIEFFKEKGVLVEIDGLDTIENVHQKVLKALGL
ncbi:MAG: nucleoside monophosphate kinase [Candidatus Pacebacteria bacterium]|nr:nucleoside monophosphate kinase [Candidatus Paceibacterota bacterium]